jgi:hypothetical protein
MSSRYIHRLVQDVARLSSILSTLLLIQWVLKTRFNRLRVIRIRRSLERCPYTI